MIFIMTTMTNDKLQTVRDYFTEDEWNAIDSALGDYQDYGETESELASSIHWKLYRLFKNE
tara:strand:- start:59 stop:241 length:183 start_codon:yes stop_codon:yes gene_type:complete